MEDLKEKLLSLIAMIDSRSIQLDLDALIRGSQRSFIVGSIRNPFAVCQPAP